MNGRARGVHSEVSESQRKGFEQVARPWAGLHTRISWVGVQDEAYKAFEILGNPQNPWKTLKKT